MTLSDAIRVLLRPAVWGFERVRDGVESRAGRHAQAVTLVLVFLGSIGAIELNRLGLLPRGLADLLGTTNHLVAIGWTVSILLVFEIIELVITLERSVASSLGAQLKVYALILIRDAFVGLDAFGEPLSMTGNFDTALAMAADAAGAVLLFLVAIWFSRVQKHLPIADDASTVRAFVMMKQSVGFVLLGVIAYLIVYDVWSVAVGNGAIRIFDIFFTTLVFADVLLAILALGFTRRYSVVFRNFAFAFVAVLLRLALTGEAFYRPAIGVTAGLFAVGVTYVYNLAQLEAMSARTSGDEAQN